MKRKKLALRGETVRLLTHELANIRGGLDDVSRAACTTAATAGNTDCPSEATGCASLCNWSCINQSCTVPSEPTGV